MVTFSRTANLINEGQIKEIEDLVGLTFPQEYKDHLLKYNGGKCTPSVFYFNEDGRLNSSYIDWFLAIYDDIYDNLKEYIEACKIEEKRMPSHIIPIAHDPGGNLICISCGDEDYGVIYFWDHEKEVDYSVEGDDDYSNLYFIAKSLNEFFNGLRDLEEYLAE